MKTIITVITIIAFVAAIYFLVVLNWKNLYSYENTPVFSGIFSCACVIFFVQTLKKSFYKD